MVFMLLSVTHSSSSAAACELIMMRDDGTRYFSRLLSVAYTAKAREEASSGDYAQFDSPYREPRAGPTFMYPCKLTLLS